MGGCLLPGWRGEGPSLIRRPACAEGKQGWAGAAGVGGADKNMAGRMMQKAPAGQHGLQGISQNTRELADYESVLRLTYGKWQTSTPSHPGKLGGIADQASRLQQIRLPRAAGAVLCTRLCKLGGAGTGDGVRAGAECVADCACAAS